MTSLPRIHVVCGDEAFMAGWTRWHGRRDRSRVGIVEGRLVFAGRRRTVGLEEGHQVTRRRTRRGDLLAVALVGLVAALATYAFMVSGQAFAVGAMAAGWTTTGLLATQATAPGVGVEGRTTEGEAVVLYFQDLEGLGAAFGRNRRLAEALAA